MDAPGWSLRVERKGHPARELPLRPGLVSIGRDRTNTVVLADRSVSRCHAILIVNREGDVYLQDVGSRNGTLLDGRPVGRMRLQPGDAFHIGIHRCVISGEPAEASLPKRRVADLPTADEAETAAGRPDFIYRQDPELFVGTSPAAQDLLRRVRKVAATRVNVLVTGESGSGKGVVGRLLHRWGERPSGPLVAVNCAAIPAELTESELFGHRRGAFTGATADRTGKFAAASGGTLFLDEVGDMSLAAQAKILRAIEEQSIEPVGSPEPVRVDVRIVAATNKDLEAAVREGRFRQDLLFRLATVRLAVPPLRERPSDVVLLANCLLAQLLDEIPGARGSFFTSEALAALAGYPWPGNVRELRNVVAQALVLKDGPAIQPCDLRLLEAGAAAGGGAEELEASAPLDQVEARHIARALEHHGWNLLRTAAALGISRKTLRDRVARYGLARPDGEE